MNVTEMLERIEKLPSEWRHPHADAVGQHLFYDSDVFTSIGETVALDLHLRAIAEKLANAGVAVTPAYGGQLVISTDPGWKYDTYALALLSAAEAVVKEGGGGQ